MYLLPRETAVPAVPDCKYTSLQTAGIVMNSLGWAFFFFLLAGFFWMLYKHRKAAIKADEVRKERDCLSLSVVRQLDKIESLRADLEVSNMLLTLAREESSHKAKFVIGNDSDSDSDDDGDIPSPSNAAFSTSLRPPPAPSPTASRSPSPPPAPPTTRSPTPTRAPSPVRVRVLTTTLATASTPAPILAPIPSGGAKTPETGTTGGETTKDVAQTPASPEPATSVSPQSLAYELAVAEARELDSRSPSPTRPSAEVR
ncbi:hypothetical protein QBC39DRAFT_352197 [Podospora conica]|nr:hypothetical protein QBC39DRAFT_352197 [Schizothecium conicum]